MELDHYNSKKEARKAYEEKQNRVVEPSEITKHRAWELESGDFLVLNGIRHEITSCERITDEEGRMSMRLRVNSGACTILMNIGINDFVEVSNDTPKESQLWD